MRLFAGLGSWDDAAAGLGGLLVEGNAGPRKETTLLYHTLLAMSKELSFLSVVFRN
jgi:hypothetical protein